MEQDAAATPLIDLNQADQETLGTLPGIGPALAARIVQFREESQPFREASEITAVAGITDRMYRQFSDRVTVSPVADESPSLVSAGAAVSGEVEDGEPEPPSSGAVGEANADEISDPAPERPQEVPVTPQQPESVAQTEAAAGPVEPQPDVTVQPTSSESPAPSDSNQSPPPSPSIFGAGYWWRSCLLTVIGILGGAVLALLIIQRINGTLEVATHPEVIRLRDDLSALEQQEARLQDEITELRTRLNQMEALSGRLQGAEADIEMLQEALTQLNEQLSAVERDTEAIESSISEIQTATDRFDSFLEGLRELLLATDESPSPTATLAVPTVTSPTVVPSSTVAIQATPTDQATPTRTPRPTRTPSPTVTATPLSALTPAATPAGKISSRPGDAVRAAWLGQLQILR